MDYGQLVSEGLKNDGNLKLIMKGSTETENNEKIAVVSVVFVTSDVSLARQMLDELNNAKKEDDYFMVYSCPQDTDLNDLNHYPSLAITKEDLL